MSENEQSIRDNATTQIVVHRPPWKAKTVWLAALLVLVGGVLWVKDTVQKPAPSAPGTAPGMTSFADPEPGSNARQDKPAGLKPTSPATFRFGVSYVGGFFLGWAFRRFIKMTLLLSGAVILLIGLGKKLGWIELDWASIEAHVRESLAWLQGEAGTIKQFLTGYLPSVGAAATGIFLGFLRK